MTAHHTALYADHIAYTQARIADVRTWPESERKAALLADLEHDLDRAMGCAQLADEQAEVAEIIEIIPPSFQSSQVVAALAATHPRTRWFEQGGVFMGIVGVDMIRIARIEGGWEAQVWGDHYLGLEWGVVQVQWISGRGASLLDLADAMVSAARAGRAQDLEVAA